VTLVEDGQLEEHVIDTVASETRPDAESGARPVSWTLRLTPRIWLAVTLVVALAVRLVNLNAVGFNSDEAVYSGQAASLAGNPLFTTQFPVFRAHPLLLPVLMSPLFSSGTPDLRGRVFVAFLGVATVFVVFLIGRELFGFTTGVLAALILAVMPYHVGVTRQVLLDGPAVLCITLAFWMFARFVRTRQTEWLLGSAAVMGLAVLTKETSIIMAGAFVILIIISPEVRRPVLTSALFVAIVGVVSITFPLVVSVAGRSSTGQNYLAWQLARSSNHAAFFYFTVVPASIGWMVVLAAGAALVFRANWDWRLLLLVLWVVVPFVALEIYPLKGFQYLLPIAPAMALLAARGLTTWHLPERWKVNVGPVARPAVAAVVVASLLVGTWTTVFPSASSAVLAGGGGIPGGREAGKWIGTHVIPGSELLTIGPSMANILTYYGHRPAQGLSVSSNPLHRNPSYTPVYNPDLSIHRGQFSFLVWDAYSAYRSPSTARHLQVLVARHHGRTIYTQRVDGKPVIVIYQVRP
jgi:MFS family permease